MILGLAQTARPEPPYITTIPACGPSSLVGLRRSLVSADALIAAAAVVSDAASSLTAEAKALLEEATKDSGGMVLMVDSDEGLSVATNGRDFVPEGDPRAAAIYRGAVRELLQAEYLRSVGSKGEVFEVTRAGYEAADRLLQRRAGGA